MMNRTASKRLCMLGLLTAAALLFGYVELFVPLDFIAPGIKLGLANTVPLFLLLCGDKPAAWLVNIVRILLSALLFGNVFMLIFSLSAGVCSVAVMALLSKSRRFGVAGISVAGAICHNLVQLLVACFSVGTGVLYYASFLLFAAVGTGLLNSLLARAMLQYDKYIQI